MEDLDFGHTIRGFASGQKVFDRYTLKEILGRGGMGVVWRGYDEQLECEVALKFLPETVAFDEQAIADLKRETKKTRELRHHHIVQVYDFVTDRRAACISMEYVDGLTLSAIKARDPRGHQEADEISGWVEQLCDALSYAHHRAKVVHRDLKPANLMLNSKGDLKITDFGIARSLSDSISMLTQARGTSGTLVYMSPQQLDGERASHLDDIYSLGATIYELLTGRPPFYSGAVERQIHTKTPPSIAQRREELDITTANTLPTVWEQTIAACLAKDPAQRPQSAGEVARRLELREHFSPSLVEDKTSHTAPPPVSTTRPPQPAALPQPRFGPRPKSKIGLAAVLGILLGVTALGGWWFGIEQPRREAERQRQAAAAGDAAQKKDAADSETARRRAIDARERLDAEAKKERLATAEKERLATAERERLAATEKEGGAAAERVRRAATTPAIASKEVPYENSLGMKFVPLAGTRVLFSIWNTRVRDYEVFVQEAGRSFDKPSFAQTPLDPVANVSWDDAKAFCGWLTARERAVGQITEQQEYRLPTDAEWSAAAGESKYPWGNEWPPPKNAGNYGASLAVDDYAFTSPVGAFPPNAAGLYDMGGNVWQWCENWYRKEMNDAAVLDRYPDLKDDGRGRTQRVVRGASWFVSQPIYILSSTRVSGGSPTHRNSNNGFRCVLSDSPPPAAQSRGSN